jgi:hypothetical protein
MAAVDPGHYEASDDGYVLVGGCIAPGDVVVTDPVVIAPPATNVVGTPARS